MNLGKACEIQEENTLEFMDCAKGLSNPNWDCLPFFPTVLSLCSADDKTQVMYTDTTKDTSLSMASSYGEVVLYALCFFSKLESD